MSKKKLAEATEKPLSALPAGYRLISVGKLLMPVHLLDNATETLSAGYRVLSLDGSTPALCATESEALAVIARVIAHTARAEAAEASARATERADALLRAEQHALWETTSPSRPKRRAKTGEKTREKVSAA